MPRSVAQRHQPVPIHRLQSLLARKNIRSFLVTNVTNIRYLTGIRCSSGFLLWRRGKGYLFLDPRYYDAALERTVPSVVVRPLKEFPEILRSVRVLGFEGDSVTVTQLRRWQRRCKNTRFVQTSGLIEELRRKKNTQEISSIERACLFARRLLKEIPVWLKPGVTERAIAFRIETRAHELGADGMAFPTIVGFGEHTASPHHHPTDRVLRVGDIVQVDLGVTIDGYCSDFSRIFFTRSPTADQRRVLRALQEAKRSAEGLLHPGIDNRSLDRQARRVLRSYGLEKAFTHALGHGVGLDIHEGVSLSRKARLKTLMKNEVITIEPGVYFPGKWGMRIEDTIVVRN